MKIQWPSQWCPILGGCGSFNMIISTSFLYLGSILDDDYELSRNMSSSMENLLFIASPESTFERTMSATASLPSYRMAKGNAEDNNVLLPRTLAEFAAETDVTLEIPSPGHSSTTSSHSSASVS